MERFQSPVRPVQDWRRVMKKLSDVGCEHYRATVRGDPRFVPYFRSERNLVDSLRTLA
jgi:phosphoenolpyruvate carboxylase